MKSKSDTYSQMLCGVFTLGNQNTTALDKLCALLFALTPIAQHYYGLYENASFTLYLVILPIMLFKIVLANKFCAKQLAPVVPLLLYEVYCMCARITAPERILYSLFFCAFLILLFSGCLNLQYVVTCAAGFGMIATGLIVVQYFSYYVLHKAINFELHGWLLPENSRWIVEVVYRANKLYRPSGFFLEPSHIFLYCLPIILCCLLLPEMNKWRFRVAIILSAGVILSTSGMGIFVIFGIWALYLLIYWSNVPNARAVICRIFSGRSAVLVFILVFLVVVLYLTVPVIRQAVDRIFSDDLSVNAIAGRTRRAGNYIRTISGKNMFFGTAGVNQDLDFSTSGFYATYIRWGICGLVFSYWFYVQGLFKLRGAYFWFSALMLLLSFFTAHTHGTFYMMYFAAFLANGYLVSIARKESTEVSADEAVGEKYA